VSALSTEHIGLSSAAARLRLEQEGPNELPARDNRSLLGIAGEVLAEPMFLLLIGATSIYLVLGHPRDALILAASMVVVVVITIYQERRTEPLTLLAGNASRGSTGR
jgi:P-type Ca2+ transporter type 2C